MKKLKLAIKILLSLALLWFVLGQIDLDRLLGLLRRCDPWWLIIAFVLYNLSKIIASFRLNYYFKDLGLRLSEWQALRLYYVGMFYNLFLPGGVGGDGYKIYLLQKYHNPGYKPLVAATLLDRLSGLVALLFLAGVLFLFSSYAKLFPWLVWLDIVCLVTLYPIFLLLHKRLFGRFTTYLWQTTLLGLGVQIVQLLSAYAIIQALPTQVPLIDFLTLFLISSVVAVLPLTIGGVGAREFTFLYGMKLLGLDPSSGIAFSFLFFLISALSSVIGIFFVHNPYKRSPSEM